MSDYHVASFVVRVFPGDVPAVNAVIADTEGLEVHAQEDGKLVVTAEASHLGELAALTEQLKDVPGVIDAAPVYHEFDAAGAPAPAPDEVDQP
ncbi:MAG: chaperone NapD [Pseudomonadota bacterium]